MLIERYDRIIQKELELFFQKAYGEMGFFWEPYGKDNDILNIEEIYNGNGGAFWTLLNAEKVIGTIGLKKIDDFIGELKRFYILFQYRNKGLGSDLIKTLVDNAKEKGFKRIRLDSTSKSSNAINLFKKNEFYEIDRYNHDIYAEIFMEKKI